MPSSASSGSNSSGKSVANLDPITRNALRYTVSAREYELLHQYLLSRAPALKKRVPRPARKFDDVPKQEEDYNAATIRVTVRLFLATYSSLKLWEVVTERLWNRGLKPRQPRASSTASRYPTLRLSLSLSSILLFHRLLHRFFVRLRASILTTSAKPFRRRNPRISNVLTSNLTAPVGAGSIAGLFLGLIPASQTRITLTIYAFTRALEFLYTHLASLGYFIAKPAWVGSWLLTPFATGQLLHAFVFDRKEAFPAGYGALIIKNSQAYVAHRPSIYSSHIPWPSTDAFVDALAQISRLRWPSFTSPILFPAATLPPSLTALAPLVNRAHPAIPRLSCAALHPSDPSCLRTYISHWLLTFPRFARFFLLFYVAFSLPRLRSTLAHPSRFLHSLLVRVTRSSVFMTGAIGTAWGSICLFQRLLPRHVFPTSRWFIGGFVAGLWAIATRGSPEEHVMAMYSARASLDSLWKVGRKRGWWKGIKGGDVLVFAASLAVVGAVYERDRKAIAGGMIRRGVRVLRGDSWNDQGDVERVESEDEQKKSE